MYEAQTTARAAASAVNIVDSIDFQFNPKEVTISKSAKWDRKPQGRQEGRSTAVQRRRPCKTDAGDVLRRGTQIRPERRGRGREALQLLVPLEKTVPKSPMPPMVVFKWGGVSSFPAVITQVNAKYTRFASNGIPIRAVCTVNLEEMPSEAGKQNPTSGVLAVDRAHTMIAGDTLALVAYREYGDPKLWRPLAAYNSIDDPMRIPNGTQVLLPGVEVLLG